MNETKIYRTRHDSFKVPERCCLFWRENLIKVSIKNPSAEILQTTQRLKPNLTYFLLRVLLKLQVNLNWKSKFNWQSFSSFPIWEPLFENGTKPGRVEGSGYGVQISGDLLVPAAHAGSCDRIDCPAGKQCLLDQNLSPHCVRCGARRCPGGGKPVCGVDGITYQSACHLREAACHKGRAIPVAYRGRCKGELIYL